MPGIILKPPFRLGRKVVFSVACAALVYQLSILVVEFPHYLPYMDYVWGGPQQQQRYLGNCNLDVGQDLHALDRELQHRGIKDINICYWGKATPPHGTPVRYIPFPPPPGVAPAGDYLAWSEGNRTYNHGFFERLPIHLEFAFQVGYTIRVYRVSE